MAAYIILRWVSPPFLLLHPPTPRILFWGFGSSLCEFFQFKQGSNAVHIWLRGVGRGHACQSYSLLRLLIQSYLRPFSFTAWIMLHLLRLWGFTSTTQASDVNSLNYWSAWWSQQGVCGHLLPPFNFYIRCNLYGLWCAWNGLTSRYKSSLHPGCSIFQYTIQNPWERLLWESGHTSTSWHPWWFGRWRPAMGANLPFG